MSNNPGSTTITLADTKPYRYYKFIGLTLCTYWTSSLHPDHTAKIFSNPVLPIELGKWLKDHGAELISGHTWDLPSEEIKVLFLLRWS